jgi:hypothetical protein
MFVFKIGVLVRQYITNMWWKQLKPALLCIHTQLHTSHAEIAINGICISSIYSQAS